MSSFISSTSISKIIGFISRGTNDVVSAQVLVLDVMRIPHFMMLSFCWKCLCYTGRQRAYLLKHFVCFRFICMGTTTSKAYSSISQTFFHWNTVVKSTP